MARFKPTREFYIPKGGVRVVDKKSTAVCYMIGKDDYHVVMGFAGKRQKPDFHYRFKHLETAQAYVAKFFKDVQRDEDYKAQAKQREAERLAEMRGKIKAGDIFYTSWGYDQTNIDFYQVVDRTAATVEIVKIGKDCVEEMTGVDMVVPNPMVKWGDTIKRKINATGFRIASYAYAFPWDGQPQHETAAGWGH